MTYPGSTPALDPDRAAVEQRRQEREIEFSTYRANQDIPWGTVPAFYGPRDGKPGEIVPKSTVEARGWLALGLVDRIDGGITQPATATSPNELTAPASPARSAAKAEWVEYAVTVRGADLSEAEARQRAESMTRDQLVAEYGKEA